MTLQINYQNIDALVGYANNSRTHSKEQIQQVANSIKEFGFTNPILVDDNNGIIAGHGRLSAAKLLKLEQVPTITLKGLTDAQKRAYVIADNQLALNAGWDIDILQNEVQALVNDNFNLDLIGFDEDFLNGLLDVQMSEGLIDEDEVPEPPVEPVSKRGDVWLLGNHRLMCGDSTSIDDVDNLMNGEKADLLFTDPPYGIDFAPQRGTHGKILNDSLNKDEFDNFLNSVFSCAISVMKPDTYAFVWTGWSKLGSFEKSLQKYFKIQALHIWVKNNFGIGYYSRPKHEPFYLCLNGKPVYPSKAPADVWDAKKVHKTIHSCEKPVGLIIDILDTYHKNSYTLDLFGGSGSTLIACEKTNRKAFLMELDEKYCDVIIKRWQDYTGKQATLESTGQTYSEVCNG